MKLVLANNQTERFVGFYDELRHRSQVPFDYAGYETLLFIFDTDAEQPVRVELTGNGRSLSDYDGVYLNGYLSTYELAAATAICCRAAGIPFVNRELESAPSLSKLTTYAKLGDSGVRVPRTLAGAKAALEKAQGEVMQLRFPLVLKRADADRGVDNYKVSNWQEVLELLGPHEPRSLWILQEFVPNDGFYLVSFYGQRPTFCIFRSLEERPDGNEQKAHMFKPKGGTNAQLVELADVPTAIIETCQRAVDAMNRQICSVDCLYEPETGRVYVLEVNYNPQLVTIETFKDVRVRAFLDGLQDIH